MNSDNKNLNAKQRAYQELFVGTLIYAVVLGFFNDYTDIVDAKSFSTIFFASIILEILTFLTFKLKTSVTAPLKQRSGLGYKIARFFSVWLIMFLSKFVFIWAIDFVFGDYININGFFGILIVVIAVTALHRLAFKINSLLSDK